MFMYGKEDESEVITKRTAKVVIRAVRDAGKKDR